MEITVNGLKVNYESEGTGQEILMLHGWGSSLDAFVLLRRHLSRKFKVVSLDFPGFGKSDMISEPWSVADYADFTLAFLSAVGLKDPIVICHSFGGRVATKLVGEGRLYPPKMVFLDAAGIKHKPSLRSRVRQATFKTIRRVLTSAPLKKSCEKLLEKARNHFGSADYNNAPPVLRHTLVLTVNEDLRGYMPSIKCPTLLVYGENDTATPVSDAKIMEQLIPDAGLCVIRGAGHFSFVDRPGEVIAILDSFFGG